MKGARRRAERGELSFGTIDSFLIWRLTGGRVHATDATNAARTLLYNIHTGDWDEAMLALFGVPRAILPEVRDSAAEFGSTDPGRMIDLSTYVLPKLPASTVLPLALAGVIRDNDPWITRRPEFLGRGPEESEAIVCVFRLSQTRRTFRACG